MNCVFSLVVDHVFIQSQYLFRLFQIYFQWWNDSQNRTLMYFHFWLRLDRFFELWSISFLAIFFNALISQTFFNSTFVYLYISCFYICSPPTGYSSRYWIFICTCNWLIKSSEPLFSLSYNKKKRYRRATSSINTSRSIFLDLSVDRTGQYPAWEILYLFSFSNVLLAKITIPFLSTIEKLHVRMMVSHHIRYELDYISKFPLSTPWPSTTTHYDCNHSQPYFCHYFLMSHSVTLPKSPQLSSIHWHDKVT